VRFEIDLKVVEVCELEIEESGERSLKSNESGK